MTRHLLTVLALSVLLVLGPAEADWIDLELPNGDFSQAGSGAGTFTGDANITDQGRILANWQACGPTIADSALSWANGSEAYIYGGNSTTPGGYGDRGYWIHDALPGYTIESAVYRLTFTARATGDHYSFRCGFLHGDTVYGDGTTWELATRYGGGAAWTLQWGFGVSDPTTFKVIWDNTGNEDAPTNSPSGPYGVYNYWWSSGATPVQVGNGLRVGFNNWGRTLYNYGHFYISNVIVEKHFPRDWGTYVVIH